VVGRSDWDTWPWSRVLWYAKGVPHYWAHYRAQSAEKIRRNASTRVGEKRQGNRLSDNENCLTNPAHYPPTKEETQRQSRTVILIEDPEAMVKEAALAAAILSCLPAHAIAQSACGGPRELTVCESELYQAGIVWEGRAHETRAKLRGCLNKLKVRTSTVIDNIVVPPLPAPPTTHEWLIIGGGVALGFVLGAALGVILE